MGVILSYLNKDIEAEPSPEGAGFNFPEFNNATGDNAGPFGFIGSGIDLINNIINQATGTTAAQTEAQRLQAEAMLEQARSAQVRKEQAIKVALIVGGSLFLTGGLITLAFYIKSKKAKK